MSKDDSAPGLLSKLVKFVRNPATSWTELDSVQTDKDDLVSKQLLKEMIERKRRNDFVRRREFDMLRKLRKLEALAGAVQAQDAKPSFFQSSQAPRPDERAGTLKKIDEIEAQMSMQWWKTKNQTTTGKTAAAPKSNEGQSQTFASDIVLPAAYRPTVASELPPAGPKASTVSEKPLLDNLFPVGVTAQLPESDAADDSGSPPLVALSAFALSTAAEQGVLVHDTELEEAAILFANSDNAGAEAGLLEILKPGGTRVEHIDTWLTLFDLYRATGEQDKFEAAAIQFIERFHRSPPQWFSLPDIMKTLAKPAVKAAPGSAVDWICPSVLGLQSVAALNAALARATMPWRLDWSNLKTIETAALEPLCKIFGAWVVQPVQLRFLGDQQLQRVMLNATPSNQADTDQRWWQLRMKMLQVIHRPEDFEMTALDFCVTYEVSPPSWESARCRYKSLDENAMGSQTIIGEASHEFVHSTLSPLNSISTMNPDSWQGSQALQGSHFLAVELSGQIKGDAAAALEILETRLMGADVMQISCAKLIRVDFSAAGMLLNWVSARQAENRSVQFCEVNRLVAAFFNVIGITEHAKVVVRIN